MRVLGIESSCDETAAAVVREDGAVLSDVVASQIEEHGPYGGVVPELASRAHLRAVLPVIRSALDPIDGGLDAIDGIAVTHGPGLMGALLVGVQVAKALAFARGLPIVGVDHLTGHLLSGFLRRSGDEPPPPPYPFVALLVSGGHTALYRVDASTEITLLGQTRDDAAGEAFDKAAKLLGLGYPGGPVIDRLARTGDAHAIPLPRPMQHKKGLELSFSGLKTAVAERVRNVGRPDSEQALADFCASFQRVVVESLVEKCLRACELESIDRLVLTGGVAANRGLREATDRMCKERGISLHIPPLRSCTDNAAMIAYAGALRLARGERDGTDLAVYSRDPSRRRGKF